MTYLLTFLEGLTAFLSPCVLPMLPLYLSYFAAGEENLSRTMKNALGFILGLTAVFVSMGAFAGTLGGLLVRYSRQVEVVAGVLIILFGLHYAGVFSLAFLSKNRGLGLDAGTLRSLTFPYAVLFGIIFSVSWTPCVGPLLGAALMQAASAGGTLTGILLLLLFSLGLGIPFLLSALLLDQLKGAFSWIKAHYLLISRVCGGLLVVMGLMMLTGRFGKLLSLFLFAMEVQ